MIWSYPIWLLPFVATKRGFVFIRDRWLLPLKTFALSMAWRINCGKNVRFIGKTIIRSYKKGSITIGDDCTFISRAENNLVGLTNPTVICAAKNAEIVIGNHVGCSSVILHAAQSIRLGSYLNIGGNVRIFDHDFHSLDWRDRRPPQNGATVRCKPVVIEDDVFIGTNAIILKGTHIGARSIVAAGSVVFGLDVPPDSMVKGNPAVVIERSK
jgi:acetyltransferase-like isoleucine patch superfamily enzyme